MSKKQHSEVVRASGPEEQPRVVPRGEYLELQFNGPPPDDTSHDWRRWSFRKVREEQKAGRLSREQLTKIKQAEQEAIERGKNSRDAFKEKLQDMAARLGIPDYDDDNLRHRAKLEAAVSRYVNIKLEPRELDEKLLIPEFLGYLEAAIEARAREEEIRGATGGKKKHHEKFQTPDGRKWVADEDTPWAGSPVDAVLKYEAMDGVRLRDGQNPVWFLRARAQFMKDRDPQNSCSFADYITARFPDRVQRWVVGDASTLAPVKTVYPGRPPATEPLWLHLDWIQTTACLVLDLPGIQRRVSDTSNLLRRIGQDPLTDPDCEQWRKLYRHLWEEVVPLFGHVQAHLPLDVWNKWKRIRTPHDATEHPEESVREWEELRDYCLDRLAKLLTEGKNTGDGVVGPAPPAKIISSHDTYVPTPVPLPEIAPASLPESESDEPRETFEWVAWDGTCAECHRVVPKSEAPCGRYGQFYCADCFKKLETAEDTEIENTTEGALNYISQFYGWKFMRIHLDQAADPTSNIRTTARAQLSFLRLEAFLRRRSRAMVRVAHRFGIDPDPLLKFVQGIPKMVNFDDAERKMQALEALLKDSSGAAARTGKADTAPQPASRNHANNANGGGGEKTPPSEAFANDDFTMVRWYGTDYTFALGVKSQAVRVLWEEWTKTGLGLHQQTIRTRIDAERDNFRMDAAFRNHPAFGKMIVRLGDGMYGLKKPDKTPPEKKKRKNR